jgi:beta propeller repeat protein
MRFRLCRLLSICCWLVVLLACGRPTSATPLTVRSTEAPTETGAPIERLPPDVSDLPRQALETRIWPRDLYGQHYVGVGQADRQVYLVDLSDGHALQVTDDGGVKLEAVLTEQYIAWAVEAGQITIRDGDRDGQIAFQHIHVLDRATGVRRRITQEPAPRHSLAADGHRLVWMDKRNELREHYTHYDLYAYDLAADAETPVAVALGAQQSPSIHGDLVVWADNRNSPQQGADGPYGAASFDQHPGNCSVCCDLWRGYLGRHRAVWRVKTRVVCQVPRLEEWDSFTRYLWTSFCLTGC